LTPVFKIAAAQVPSVRGDIDRNIATHAAAISLAAKHQISVLVFPELSLTGYEPDLADELAITPSDNRLAFLVALAQQHQMEVVVGAPLRGRAGKPVLGAILISASGNTRTYAKMHLGDCERAYFAAGDTPLAVAVSRHKVGIAICADTSQPSHPETYADSGATIYAAGVFLNAEWYATDAPRLASYAGRYRMLTVMANHAASVGTYTSVGKSAAWAPDGALLAQAEGTEDSLLIATSHVAGWRGEVIKM
jgi:predicted amidohydrolase